MDTQLKKGLLDVSVLKVLSMDDSYGYKILYAVLKRLELQQLVTTYKEEHDSRLRKYYHITSAGIARLQDFSSEFTKIERIIRFVLQEGNI
jgi:PadR family transcriptional regulator PadR